MLYRNCYAKQGNSFQTSVWLKAPNECPMCHISLEPKELSDKYIEDTDTLYKFLLCTNCKHPFISEYKNPSEIKDQPTDYRVYPILHEKYKFDKEIENLSKNFTIIYNQALQAESEQLNQICGIGYRKALEFLIKDYCIYKNPDKEEIIKSNFLGKVINDYIDSDKIHNLAQASAWLGNDETHYIRKFEDKDINDLKRFIFATVAFITYELISDEADDFVSSK